MYNFLICIGIVVTYFLVTSISVALLNALFNKDDDCDSELFVLIFAYVLSVMIGSILARHILIK